MKIVQPPDFVIKSKNGTAGFLWDKKFAVRKNADVLKVQKYVDSTVLRLNPIHRSETACLKSRQPSQRL